MQRILQPGEIEALDHTSFPRVRLPQPGSLFADRAARLRQLAQGNAIADYLRFAAQLVQAQQRAAATVHTVALPADQLARAQAHSMPLMPAANSIDPAWQAVLEGLLDTLEQSGSLPATLAPVIARLRARTPAALDALAVQVLGDTTTTADLALQPFIMAALQVTFADRASRLGAADVPFVDPATICPVCASQPVASVLRIGGQAAGHRYLHCGTCCTEWHMVRVKCSHCESTQGIHYQGVEGGSETVLAETCDECHTYRKLVNQEKDPLAEPLADDLASLTLDLLMGDTAFARASANPLLALGRELADDATHDA
ncbi:formate dehydrogenase accessory protein FdhE [Ramlibacter sp. H39-3-26]|uniref:formate dehydrogenase accessory protein FdhE n=1 Tax=Curvibacter soli TaxID=3031331 RepID=UPI0023DA7071|nr:formate dehydrogenase accessory protein FdhE [Ramlibacter sp. H39-3-26]MDF1485115.1 formate dehydrogenase accessory protein FdhE [Ramlibacter sp. H39-3-26]